MKVLWSWLSEMVDLREVGGPTGLAELLTRRGLEVEEVQDLAKGFEQVVTAQILERNKHPDSDRLSLCKVSLGSGEPLEIVCGAQNMKAGDKVVLAQVGAFLPNGVKIERSKIRGVVSNGMLCSEAELKLSEESAGIMILPASTQLGKPLAEILGRNDAVLTLKLTANRGDCMSHYGIAREVAAALGVEARRPGRGVPVPLKGSPVSVHLEAGEAGPQFLGVFIDGIKIKPSPDWLVRRLEALGHRSINNVVDASNLVMLEQGQPTHAYDATLIKGGRLAIRLAKAGEELPLLDGKTVKLDGTELVIADAERAVGLAGVMGGGNSEVRESTTKIFLECAEFAPVQVRRGAFKHQRRTDAAQRFEKGVDPAGLHPSLSRLSELVVELAGGKIVGGAQALHLSRDSRRRKPIRLEADFVKRFLGISVEPAKIEKILAGLDCKLSRDGDAWQVEPPSYRMDLLIREDLAEEVARTVGYDQIPSTVPVLTSNPTPSATDPQVERNRAIDRTKDLMARLGLLETVNYGFTGAAWLKSLGMCSSVPVLNPLSEEHEVLVPSLLPGLVKNAIHNWRHHFGSESLAIRLFELRPTFHCADKAAAKGETETGVEERWRLAFGLSGPRLGGGLRNEQGVVDFSDLKAVIERLMEGLGTRGVRFSPMSQSRVGGNPVFHPGQSSEVLAGNSVAGAFGLVHPGLARSLKLREPLWLAELDWDAVFKLSRNATGPRPFSAWSEFPSMERDFALVVKNEITVDRITQVALKAGKPLAKVAKVFDIYRGPPVVEGMTSVAVRVIFSEEGRSLQESETEAASAQILAAWKKELNAELR